MQRLSTVEAERVIAVLNNALENMHLLSRVPPPERADKRFVASLEDRGSHELAAALQTQWQLEESTAVIQRSSARATSRKGGSGAGAGGLGDIGYAGGSRPESTRPGDDAGVRVAKSLSKASRELCRHLRGDGEAVEVLAEKYGPTDNMVQMLEAVAWLKDLSFTKLNQTYEESVTASTYAANVAQRHREQAEAQQELEAELWVQRKRMETEANEMDAIISKLQSEVDMWTRDLAAEATDLDKTVKQTRGSNEEAHRNKMQKLRADIDHLERDIAEARETYMDREMKLRKKQDKAKREVSEIIVKYDTKMLEIDEEKKRIRELYVVEKEKLTQLQEHFDKMEADKHRADEEDRLYNEAKAREDAIIFKTETEAAINIQRVWKSFWTRKHLPGM